jgi:SAM-dependent methyltransferase
MSCRICGSSRVLGHHEAREMMTGSREAFGYFQCADCLCLQIDAVPADLPRHYEGGYYSYREAERKRNPLKRWTTRTRDRWAVFGGGALGRRLYERAPLIELRALQPLKLKLDSRVLDVGCGAGYLVFALGELGMRHTMGVDPYLPNQIVYDNGVTVKKQTLEQTAGPWDAIMFHHSFEHLPDPRAVLLQVAERLAPGGQCLLRVPTVSSLAWQEYGTDWVQLDAPRHLYLFAHESIRHLAEATGFELEGIVHDSTAFQFWGSEQYRMGIPLQDPRSHAKSPGTLFTAEQIAAFEKRSAELNAAQQGDQAAFYLRKRS